MNDVKKTETDALTAAETIKIQFSGLEYDLDEIKAEVEADYKSKFEGEIESIQIYIKPEDRAAYYVINSEIRDMIGL